MKKFLITSALPYANAPLHFGHLAGAFLPADCFARFERMQGSDVLYICGSDEYGLPITIHAEMAGRTPQEHVDLYHKSHQEFFKKLCISFDHYSRTTWPGHVETVQQYFLDLLEGGYIEEKETLQLYCEKDRRFLADRYVIGECPKCGMKDARGDECPKCGASYEATELKHPRSKLNNASLILKPTRHFFLRFELFKNELSSWIAQKKWKPTVLHFAKAYIEDLHSRAITRDSTWGVPIPLKGTEDKVFYVWFDAPIGYISSTKEWALLQQKPEAWKKYWLDPDTTLVHFIGKDNIPFHAVFFPAMTMGQKIPYKLVDELPANEFLNLEGKKFSKSEGWTIDVDQFFTQFTVDQIRYYLAAHAPENQDSEFNWKTFQLTCNADLLGKYGNLAQRTLVFIQKECEGKIPSPCFTKEDLQFLTRLKEKVGQIQESYRAFSLRKASFHIMELASMGNSYFDAKKPWTLAKGKQEGDREKMNTVLYTTLECLKFLALVSFPLIPNMASSLWKMLGFTTVLSMQQWSLHMKQSLQEGTMLPPPEPLCQKIEDEIIQKEIETLHNNTPASPVEKTYVPLKESLSFEEFSKLDLRVGQIKAAEKVEKSQKLLKLTVDLGFEVRTIVSGIAKTFTDLSVLVGKKVVVVANLKPAKLMGIESQGMIMAADIEGGAIELLDLETAKAGDVIR